MEPIPSRNGSSNFTEKFSTTLLEARGYKAMAKLLLNKQKGGT